LLPYPTLFRSVVVAAADARRSRQKEANRVGGTRLDPRGAEGGTQAHAVDPAPFREERLLGYHVRHVHLRVIHRLEVRSEGAVAIGPQARRDVKALLVAKLLLHERAQRL